MKKHIFLVDDDRDEMLFFTEALKQVPFPAKCTWANSGRQALKQLVYLTPDLILLDLCMPEMNGLECLEAMKSIPSLRGIPVILHSSALSPEVRLKAVDLGAVACIEKSETVTGLAQVLASFLDGREQLRAV